MGKKTPDPYLIEIKKILAAREEQYLGPHAEKSRDALRRHPEYLEGHRPAFAVDTDRILHSRAYTRYIDKTQVFYMVRNDHITHRVLHVQLVSKIARTIGRVLSLNEDLIESIALGHDIGHPPFGHDGEKILDSLCREHGLPSFQHNLQSVRFLEHIEKKGSGVNLTLQTLDGILCHDGEVHDRTLKPLRDLSFAAFDEKLRAKAEDPRAVLAPMTLEGCVVRFADTVSYIGRDIEDAIELGLIKRSDIPEQCREMLGETNGTIVHNLVTDLLKNSRHGSVGFSREISDILRNLKKFNYERIYLNPVIKKDQEKIRTCYRCLFYACLEEMQALRGNNGIFADFAGKMDPAYVAENPPAAIVCDFLAGMTDDYFLKQASLLGCVIPQKA
ncbi:MAG: HD domain-containing protein [Deltaproteobacteria bacterium]|nr:HD domain-containing protein [Deltaproteobacteria bacterium]